jgi:hypothetical protein
VLRVGFHCLSTDVTATSTVISTKHNNKYMHMEDTRNAYGILLGKHEAKQPVEYAGVCGRIIVLK